MKACLNPKEYQTEDNWAEAEIYCSNRAILKSTDTLLDVPNVTTLSDMDGEKHP